MQTIRDLAIVTALITAAVYYFDLAQGWELLMFSALIFMLFGFHVYFVRYIDAQKSFEPSEAPSNE